VIGIGPFIHVDKVRIRPFLPLLILALLGGAAVSCSEKSPVLSSVAPKEFNAKGVVMELRPGSVVLRHDEITNYMPAMTMAFRVKQTNEMAGLKVGDQIAFRLLVTEDESWIDRVKKTGASSSSDNLVPSTERPTNALANFRITDIPDFAFTNEFGQRVSLRQFRGQAVAFTFFFTRCPIPEYCPRLSKNFQSACERLSRMPNAPTNWHLFSISFDPLDNPAILQAYAKQYRYDPSRWTFLTGVTEEIRDLADGFGVRITLENGAYTHNFRTVVFDAAGRLQNSWMLGGDTTDQLVGELIKGAQAK